MSIGIFIGCVIVIAVMAVIVLMFDSAISSNLVFLFGIAAIAIIALSGFVGGVIEYLNRKPKC